MKKTLCLLILIFYFQGFVAYGQQNQIYEKIQSEKESNLDFINMSSIFKKVSEVHETLSPFENNEEISFIHYEKVKFVELSKAIFLTIPFKNSHLEVELLEVPASFYNYEVVTNEGQRFPSNKQIKHYRGVVKNNPSSLVAISFLENEVIGLVATDDGNYNLVLDKKSGRHVFYNDRNLKDKMDF